MPIDASIYNNTNSGNGLLGVLQAYQTGADRKNRLAELAKQGELQDFQLNAAKRAEALLPEQKRQKDLQELSGALAVGIQQKNGISNQNLMDRTYQEAKRRGLQDEDISQLFAPWAGTEGHTDGVEASKQYLQMSNPQEYGKQAIEAANRKPDAATGVHTLEVGVQGKPDYRQKQEKTINGWNNVGPAYQIPAGTTAAAKALAPKPISNVDARSIDKSMTSSSSANAALLLLDQADALYQNYTSGKDEPISGHLSRWGSLTGNKNAEQHAKNFEIGGQIAKDLGVIKLGLIGGSDTERELQVAIDTAPSPDKRPSTNKEIIKNQRKAISIIQSEPDFKTQWVEKNGSLSKTDIDTKEPYGKAWRRYQKEMFNENAPNQQNSNIDSLLEKYK